MLHGMHLFVATLFPRVLALNIRFVKMQNLLARARCYGKPLARQDFYRRALAVHRTTWHWGLPMAVIVIFEVFEDVADVQERVSIQPNVDECRLHAGQDPRYFSFVDAADERELFLTLNVDFD